MSNNNETPCGLPQPTQVRLIEPVKLSTNWQQVRIQFVGQIASAIISNYEFYTKGIAEECKKSGKLTPEIVAQMSLEIADALIAELKKGGEDGRD